MLIMDCSLFVDHFSYKLTMIQIGRETQLIVDPQVAMEFSLETVLFLGNRKNSL